MDRKKVIQIFIILIFMVIVLNYNSIDAWLINSLEEGKMVKVDRVIDGDTIEVNDSSIRLLGINTPERGEKYYKEAKKFLEQEVWNKKVRLEYGKDKTDRYGRELAYLILDGRNVNLKMVEMGFANYYFPSGKDMYYDDFQEAWKKCLEENFNLCEASKSICAHCIELKNFGYGEEILLYNKCGFDCELEGWNIKDEGRKKFTFENFSLHPKEEVLVKAEDFGKTYVWTKAGDSIFLRDSEQKIVLWESY